MNSTTRLEVSHWCGLRQDTHCECVQPALPKTNGFVLNVFWVVEFTRTAPTEPMTPANVVETASGSCRLVCTSCRRPPHVQVKSR